MTGKANFILTFILLFLISVIILYSITNNEPIWIRYSSKYSPDVPLRAENESVVKIIHQSWKTKDIPSYYRNYSKSWTANCFKDWKYMLWTDEDNVNLIRNHYPWFLNKYNQLPGDIYRADVIRYFYLFHYGGIYTDLDNECLRPFEHLLVNYSMVFGSLEGQFEGITLKEGYVQNSFMYSIPKHEFWLRLIFEILNFNKYSRPEAYTILLSNHINSFRDGSDKTKEIIIYPPHYFNPLSWLDGRNSDKFCRTAHKISREQYAKCRSSMVATGSYVMQYRPIYRDKSRK